MNPTAHLLTTVVVATPAQQVTLPPLVTRPLPKVLWDRTRLVAKEPATSTSQSSVVASRASARGPNTHRLAHYARPPSPIRFMRKFAAYSLVDSIASRMLGEWVATVGCGPRQPCTPKHHQGPGEREPRVTEMYGYQMRSASACDVGPDTSPLPPPLRTDYVPGRAEHLAGPMSTLRGYYPPPAVIHTLPPPLVPSASSSGVVVEGGVEHYGMEGEEEEEEEEHVVSEDGGCDDSSTRSTPALGQGSAPLSTKVSRQEKEFRTVIRVLVSLNLMSVEKASTIQDPDADAPDYPDASLFVDPLVPDPFASVTSSAEPSFRTVSGVRFDFSDRQQRQLAERYARSVVAKTLEGHEALWEPWLKFIAEQVGEPNYPGPRLEHVVAGDCPSVDHARALWVSLYMVWLPGGAGIDPVRVPRHITALRAFFWSKFPFYDDFFDLAVARRGKKGKGPMTAEQIHEALTSKDKAFKDCVPVEYHALAKLMCWDRRDWDDLPSMKLAVAYFCSTVLRESGGRVGNVAQTGNLAHILYAKDFVFRVPSDPTQPQLSSTVLLKGGNAIRDYLRTQPLSSVIDVTFKNLSTKVINSIAATSGGGVSKAPEYVMTRGTKDASSTLDIWLEVFRETNIQTDDMLGTLYHQSSACRTGAGSTLVPLPHGGQLWQPFKTTQGNVNAMIKTVCGALGLDPSDYSSKSVGRIFVFTNRAVLGLSDAEALEFCGFAPDSVVPFAHYNKLAPKPSTSSRTNFDAEGGASGFVNVHDVLERAASRKRSLTSRIPTSTSAGTVTLDGDGEEGVEESLQPQTERGKRVKRTKDDGFYYAPPLNSIKSARAQQGEALPPLNVPFLPGYGFRVVPAGRDTRNPLLPYVPRSFFEVAPAVAKNEWPNPLPIGESLWALPGCTSSPGQAIGEFVFDLPYLPLTDVSSGKVDGTFCIRISTTHCVDTRSAYVRGECWLSACNNLSGLVDPRNGNKKYASHDNKLAFSFDYESRPGQVVLRLYTPKGLRNITERIELGWPYGYQNMPPWKHLCSRAELALWDSKPSGRTLGLAPPAGFYDVPGNADASTLA